MVGNMVKRHHGLGRFLGFVWLLLLVGSVSFGIAVWMMDSMAQRMGHLTAIKTKVDARATIESAAPRGRFFVFEGR